ncbi:MAG TPA: serine hydrolase domain-containing protein [Chitinophagaceae bacterium]|nr:serine hydrolase domain-containing protein [Chitinophagaceae bacterium]
MIRFISYIIFCFVAYSCNQSAGNNKHDATLKDPNSDFSFRQLSAEEIENYSETIKNYYNDKFGKSFNGSVLVAKNGEILFEDYKGLYNFQTKEPITEHTAFHLASISKTFTAMTILKLWEEHRLSLDDTLQKFFPKLPYSGITVKMLLNHRSGLPNYIYFMDSCWNKKQEATNWDVVNFMVQHKPKLMAIPNRGYHYCNTNYLLLALIIEIVTTHPYPQYMKDSVFTPLGLKDTYVFFIGDTAKYIPTYSVAKPFPMDHLDCTYGDKNVYSTVRDLFQWDKTLYEHTFLQKSTLNMAFMPYSNEHKTMHNYGLGWHLYFNNGDTLIYHNGRWHGSRTAFTRLVQDTATIIMLGNKVNNNIYHSREIGSIFTGRQDVNKLEE